MMGHSKFFSTETLKTYMASITEKVSAWFKTTENKEDVSETMAALGQRLFADVKVYGKVLINMGYVFAMGQKKLIKKKTMYYLY